MLLLFSILEMKPDVVQGTYYHEVTGALTVMLEKIF